MPFDKKYLGKFAWYRQGGGIKAFTISYPWLACTAMTVRGRAIPVYYRDLYGYFRNDFALLYFPETSMEWVANYYVKRQEHNGRFIQQLKKWWDTNPKAVFVKQVEVVEAQDFAALTSAQFYRTFLSFSRAYMAMWKEALFHDAFDLMGERIIDACVKEARLAIGPDEIRVLATGDEPSELQKEKFALGALANYARRNARLKSYVVGEKWEKIKKDFPDFYQRVAGHADQYHWLHNDYAHVVRLDARDFLNAMRELLVKPEALHELASARRDFAAVRQRKHTLYAKLKLSPRMQNIFQLIAAISQWRDDRKACNQIGNAVVKKFTAEISRRSGISEQDLEYALYWEHTRLFSPTPEYARVLAARRKGDFGFILHPGPRAEILMGSRAKKVSEFLDGLIRQKEMRGRSAYPGVVSGIARIILDKRDFSKLKSGDILVAPNTRPEYVPIMKIARAIVSEEGGLTCHSAIVSRELHIPCIVGVQGVLDVLKDGDKIEVDATKGIVRKI